MPRTSRAVASPARTAGVGPTSTTVPSSTTTAWPSASEAAAGSSTAALRSTIRPASSGHPSVRSRQFGEGYRRPATHGGTKLKLTLYLGQQHRREEHA